MNNNQFYMLYDCIYETKLKIIFGYKLKDIAIDKGHLQFLKLKYRDKKGK